MRRTLVMVAIGLAALMAWPALADAAPARTVPCSQASQRIVLTHSARLDPRCAYTAGIDVTASRVTLDCRGALIDGIGKDGAGVLVHAPAEADLSRVTIRNCRVTGFLNSIRVTRDGFRSLAAGHEYDHGIRDVSIDRVRVSGSRGVGIYVDGYVTRTAIRDSTITGAGSSGVYLEAGSARNVVARNQIVSNGFRENGPAGSLISFAGAQFRFWGIGREGISVDGSRANVIRSNTLAGNSAGAIFLYTNCGEYVRSRPERWFERRYGADRNVIAGNRVRGGVNGVWVASRMGESTLPMECSDPPYFKSGLTWITVDRAARNTIASNHFDDVTYGVRVEDDHTRVVGNEFRAGDPTHHAVVIGTPYRTTALDRPVRDTVLVGNRAWIRGNADPYRWVEGEAATTDRANSALGRRAHLCQGRTLPRGPFVMTLAFAFEAPGAPPTPAPDLTVPTVGVLAPCAKLD